jgi:hypothetical protein
VSQRLGKSRWQTAKRDLNLREEPFAPFPTDRFDRIARNCAVAGRDKFEKVAQFSNAAPKPRSRNLARTISSDSRAAPNSEIVAMSNILMSSSPGTLLEKLQ